MTLLGDLQLRLARSASVDRKAWAQAIVDGQVPVLQLIGLFDSDQKTAQRFMWLIGDVCELNPPMVAEAMPILFSLRDEMPFPGMRRSVAKWLWLTEVPSDVEAEAIPELMAWLRDDDASIACRSFAAKAVLLLVEQRRVDRESARAALECQLSSGTVAFQKRMVAAIESLRRLA